MRHRSETWSKLAARGRFQMEVKARIAGKDYTAISAPVISRSLMSSPLSVGNCTSATLSLSILTDDKIVSANPITILGCLTSEGQYSEWLEFGTFYINQRDTSYDGLITVDCYDAMLKANQNYLDSDDTSGWPKTMKEVVEEIAYRIGVGIDPRTRIRTGDDYVVSAPTEKTMMQVLGYIGACHGGNWIITEENLLRLVPLIPIADETFHIIDADYNRIKAGDGSLLAYQLTEEAEASAEDSGEQPDSVVKTVHRITDELGQPIVTSDGYSLIWAEDGQSDAVYGIIDVPVVCGELTKGTNVTITGVSASDESGTSFETGDDSGFLLSIESNPYMTQGICDDLCVAFEGLIYKPYTATKSCYDPATELGDQVKIGDTVRSVLYSANIRLDLDFRSDISAPNSEELSAEYPYQSTKEALEKANTKLESKVDKTDNDQVVSMLNASADEISISGDRLVIDSTNFKLTADGTMTASNGKFSGTVSGGKITQTGTSTDEDDTTTYQDELTIENGQIKTTGNIYTGRNFAFTRSYDIVRTIFAQWADGQNHDALRLLADGLTMALGWSGSSSYLTELILRGQTITADGNMAVAGSLSACGYTVPQAQHGSLSVTAASQTATEFSVTFSKTFSGIPNVALTPQHDSGTGIYYKLKTVSASGFTGDVYHLGSSSLNVTVHWIALYG